ncbi:MAG TPA: DegV family protein [Planococcus sp. (in: firmicutes)]|nr:DegV family protein [Planococcus sp. (in: firmicutes)]
MKTAILTDSTSYISKEIREELDIHMIPLQVIFKNESFKEEMELDSETFYRKTRAELPKTSQPPLGEFVNCFDDLAKRFDAVISIHLSSGISGTCSGAMQAGQMVEGIDVLVFDSEVSCAMQGFYVIKAAKMAKAGESPERILAELEGMKHSLRAYFMVDDLQHLQRGGRLSGAQALIGGMLQIKPVLHFDNKEIVPYEKIRTRKKAMNRIVELLKEDVASGDAIQATLIHANRPAEAAEWLIELEEKLPQVDFGISYFGPVIGTHLGEGSMGIGWVKK